MRRTCVGTLKMMTVMTVALQTSNDFVWQAYLNLLLLLPHIWTMFSPVFDSVSFGHARVISHIQHSTLPQCCLSMMSRALFPGRPLRRRHCAATNPTRGRVDRRPSTGELHVKHCDVESGARSSPSHLGQQGSTVGVWSPFRPRKSGNG